MSDSLESLGAPDENNEENESIKVRGKIESFFGGLAEGWVAVIGGVTDNIELRIYIGARILATGKPTINRPDVEAIKKVTGPNGFSIAWNKRDLGRCLKNVKGKEQSILIAKSYPRIEIFNEGKSTGAKLIFRLASSSTISDLIDLLQPRRFISSLHNYKPNDQFVGLIKKFEPARIEGWIASKTTDSDRCFVSLCLGGIVVAECEAAVPRQDVAEVIGAKRAFGFVLQIRSRDAGAAIAQLLVQSNGSLIAQATISCRASWTSSEVTTESSIEDEFVLKSKLQIRRTLEEWLDYFGICLENEILAARKPIYRQIAKQVWQGSGDEYLTIPELYFSSMAIKRRSTASPLRTVRNKLVELYFNADYYVRKYGSHPGVQQDPLAHYLTTGAASNFDPHPLFLSAYYRKALSEKYGGQPEYNDPFAHFLMYYNLHDIDPHPTFSQKWYKLKYKLPKNRNAWVDYIEGGWHFLREPNWLFDQANVISYYRNIKDYNNISPLELYLTSNQSVTFAPHALLPKKWGRKEYTAFILDSKNEKLFSTPLFDKSFYRSQTRVEEWPLGDAIIHYFSLGELSGAWPNVIFSPVWYRKTYNWTSDLVGPFLHFLQEGEKSKKNPSPYFSTRFYTEKNNDVAIAGVAPTFHFLTRHTVEARRRPCARFDSMWFSRCFSHGLGSMHAFMSERHINAASPHPALIVGTRAAHSDVRELLECGADDQRPMPFGIASVFGAGSIGAHPSRGEVMTMIDAYEAELDRRDPDATARLRMDEPITRLYELFDDRHAEGVRNKAPRSPEPGPLVSVIIPARNRSSVIARAIKSVLRQTYENIELIIIDDGSSDGTAVTAAGIKDDRLRVITIPPSGVSAARNVGLTESKGEYVAYLDSDNTWEHDYISTMIGYMNGEKLLLAHSALRVFTAKGIIRYRGDVYDRDAMDRENYIDMNVFVHHRQIIDAGVRFDETLKRCVDWDFIRRSCLSFGPSQYIPIVGCNYLDDDGKLERITTNELQGDFFRLCIRQINLAPHLTGNSPTSKPSYSFIWPVSRAEESFALFELWEAARHLRRSRHELIVVASALSDDATAQLSAMSRQVRNMRVIHLWRNFLHVPSVALALRIAEGERLLLWSGHIAYDHKAIDRFMAETNGSPKPIEFPTIVDAQDRIESGLFSISNDGAGLITYLSGQARPRNMSSIAGVANSQFPVSISRSHLEGVGGFDLDFILNLGMAELAVRSLASDPASVVLRTDCALHQARAPVKRGDDKSAEHEAAWFATKVKLPTGVIPIVLDDGPVRALKPRRRIAIAQEAVGAQPVPLRFVSKRNRAGGLRIDIRCPAPDDATTLNWGDWHFAQSLSEGLVAHGQTPTIKLKPYWSQVDSGIDVALHIRGIETTVPVPGAINVIWVISHPEKLMGAEVEAADLVIVTSAKLAKFVKKRFGIEAAVLPQATDAKRFQFIEDPPRKWLRNRLVFIGNSRKQPRRIVLDTIENGLPLDIYGKDWEYYLPKDIIRGTYVANEEVASYYRSAAIVLNDHWPSMARQGIVSNRLFDVVACGGIAISDEVEGIDELFGGHVRTASDARTLADLVSSLSEWAPDFEARKEMSRAILADHSFEVRAGQIVQLLNEL